MPEMPDPKEDWTERLTEEERKALNRHPSGKATLLRHECCYDVGPALRTVAALRALVKEKDKALEEILEGGDVIDRAVIVTDVLKWEKSLVLTEDDMRKRLEVK